MSYENSVGPHCSVASQHGKAIRDAICNGFSALGLRRQQLPQVVFLKTFNLCLLFLESVLRNSGCPWKMLARMNLLQTHL